MTNIKDDWYDEDRGRPVLTPSGMQIIATEISNDYRERWNFAHGGVETVKKMGL